MSIGQAAKVEKKIAQLSSDFGLALFMRKAGSEAEALLAKMGKYSKGKNAGKYKGCVVWLKVVAGGFDYSYSRKVVYPNTSFGYKLATDFDNAMSHYNECYDLTSVSEEKQALLNRISELETELAELEKEIMKSQRYIKRCLECNDIEEAKEGESMLLDELNRKASKIERLNKYNQDLKTLG